MNGGGGGGEGWGGEGLEFSVEEGTAREGEG